MGLIFPKHPHRTPACPWCGTTKPRMKEDKEPDTWYCEWCDSLFRIVNVREEEESAKPVRSFSRAKKAAEPEPEKTP